MLDKKNNNKEIIQQYYEDYNFPSLEKLYSLLKKII